MIDRRQFLAMVAGGLLSRPLAAVAQEGTRIPRVGFIRLDRPPQAYLDGFEQGLHEWGYAPGKDLLIEYRFADKNAADLPRLAVELVRSNVDVIVVVGSEATHAAKNATSTIPIVMVSIADPVRSRFVASLAHPGGNITGTSIFGWELLRKRIELLRQALPKLSRIAVLVNATNPAWSIGTETTPSPEWKETLGAAAALGVNLRHFAIHGIADLDGAFGAMIKDASEALVVTQDVMLDSPPYRIVQLAASNKLPTIYGPRVQVDAGGLMCYGPYILSVYKQSAAFVAKILKGTSPRELPVEQPTKFELIINLRTAKELGLTIPQSLLLRADELIQ